MTLSRFYPALRLSENETAAQMQRDLLRNVLSGFTFGRSDGQSAVRLLEISLQEKKDIQTLEKVNGLPVLVNLDSEPVQRELTRAVQNSHCELLDSGISKHPLNTLPLLTGDALPAENAISPWTGRPSRTSIPRTSLSCAMHLGR